jgi:8-oxo-dGTP diphosphatase
MEERVVLTTLCYIEQDGKLLMLYRNKKKSDVNAGKWIGVGGKFEPGETPEECLLREVYEETGLTLTDYRFNGVIRFASDGWDTEDMYLYTGLAFTGALTDCNEGVLQWVPKEEVMKLNLWEGDRIFLKALLEGRTGLHIQLKYKGDALAEISEDF